jgi:hypothetical protein
MRRLHKIILLALIPALFFCILQIQHSLNVDRDRFGLTRVQPLTNAPPALAFTTVALGGFRGLIANALWMRATDLQDEDKFFEMAQLADWITKLEPHYGQVWFFQAWNMAYNISVKFKDAPDRWRWVKHGIELLRDEGLKYNPTEVLLYRELAWIFQHKMGANLDDMHMYYKRMWRDEMQQIFKTPRPNWDELIHPTTDDAKQRAKLLREKYKMDPAFMKECDEKYGPMEWRLPEAHAIYWASLGLKYVSHNERRINKDDIITLHRVIYQSMQLAFRRGQLRNNPLAPAGIDFGPNLDIIRKTNDAYEQAIEGDEKFRANISTGHRNFLRDAAYFLYTYNRPKAAAEWYAYLAKRYPDKPLIEGNPNSLPSKLSIDDYVTARLEEEVRDQSNEKTRAVIESSVATSLFSLAMGEDDRAVFFKDFAEKVWRRYKSKAAPRNDADVALQMPPVSEIQRQMLDQMLNPTNGLPLEMQLVLRQKLGLPAPTNAPPSRTSK